jgi:glycosyltransferase 2 family protein
MASGRRRPPLWRRLLPLIGLLLLGWVLARLELRDLGRAFARVSLATVLASAGWFALNLWLKVWRWQRLLLAQGVALPHRVALAAFMSGQFYAQVTVGRVGEFVRIEALLERGLSAGAALSSCVFDRLLDVFLVLAAGSVLGAFVLGQLRAALAAAGMMLLLALLAAAALRWLTRAPPPERGRGWMAKGLAALRELARGMLPMTRPRVLLEAAGWTCVAWLGYFAALFTLADGLHVVVPRALLAATAAFAALSALLPVTISGLGARELIYIEVLRAHGVSGEAAVALSLLHLLVMTASAIALGLAGVAWRAQQRSSISAI